jgi:hypothetical protein
VFLSIDPFLPLSNRDNPAGNDAPLASFPSMPFFSVAPSLDETPDKATHVGALEYGTAVVLGRLCDLLEAKQGASPNNGGSSVASQNPATLASLTADASTRGKFVLDCREAATEALERDRPQPARI